MLLTALLISGSFLICVREEQEALLIAKRRQTANHVPQQLPRNSAAPTWNNQPQQQSHGPGNMQQQHAALPGPGPAPFAIVQPQFANQQRHHPPLQPPQQQFQQQQQQAGPPAVAASSVFFGGGGGHIPPGPQQPVPWYQQPPQQQQWFNNNDGGNSSFPPRQHMTDNTSYPPQQLGNGPPLPPPPGPYYQQQQQHLAPPQQQFQQQQQYGQHPQQQQQQVAAAPQPPQVQQQQHAPAPAPAPAPAHVAPIAPPMCTMYATLCLPRSGGRSSSAAAGTSAAAATAAAASSSGKPVAPMLEVQMGYHECADNALRRVGGGTWDSRRRVWIFPLSSHDKILEALKNASGVKVKVEPLHHLPAAVLKSASSIPDDSSRYCHIPTTLEEQLMAFQREGVKFGLLHGGRVLIGDEMGLGKTVQAIALAAAYRDEWPGLIIAPSSLREQWADALHKWLGVTEDRVHIVNTGKDAAAVPKNGIDFLIVSYNFLDKMVSERKLLDSVAIAASCQLGVQNL
jgi:SNF2-related domain